MGIIFYTISFGIILSLLHKGEKYGDHKSIILGYVLLFLLSALRFDIGNDYATYWSDAETLGDVYGKTKSFMEVYNWRDGRFEFGFCVLVGLFHWSSYIFFWVAMLISALFVLSIYKVFSKYECHFWGVLLVIVSEYLFLQWDGVRQSGALALVLIAMMYANDRKLLAYMSLVIIASFLHKSALFMLFAYPLVYVKVNNRFVFSLIVVSLLIYWTGILDNFVSRTALYFSYVDGYDKYDMENVALMSTHTTIFSRIRVTFFVIICSLIVKLLDDEYAFFRNILTIGIVIYMLGGSTLLFMRISWYFMLIMFPCFGLCMNNMYNNDKLRRMLLYIALAQCVVFTYDVTTNTNARGCVPYESVFSEEFQNQQFRIRGYK